MTRRRDRSYATLRLQSATAERVEGFADMAQAAAWTLAHRHEATWESVVPDVHDNVDLVLALFEGDAGAHARFLVRCGESDQRIAETLAGTDVDLPVVLARARDELAVMAEHEDP